MPEQIVSRGLPAFQAKVVRIRERYDDGESDAMSPRPPVKTWWREAWSICWKAKAVIVLLVIGFVLDRIARWVVP